MGKINTDIYMMIKESGKEGVTFKEIMIKLDIEFKYVRNVIGGLMKSNLISWYASGDTKKFIASTAGRKETRYHLRERKNFN